MFLAATYLSSGSELLLEILGPGIVGGLFDLVHFRRSSRCYAHSRKAMGNHHKSIVLLDAVEDSLVNVVHHFHLKQGYAELPYRRAYRCR